MEYIILLCLIILIIITVIILLKIIGSKTDLEVLERLAKFEMSINDRNIEFERNLNRSFDLVSEKLDRKLNLIYDNVNNRLDDNFKKSNETFRNILERLATIDSAQKKIDNLLQKGLIRHSTSSWGSQVNFVIKDERFSKVMYRLPRIGQKDYNNKYPLPRIDDKFD